MLFPKRCLGCGAEGFFVCESCLRTLSFLEDQRCPMCGRKSFFGGFCGEKCKSGFHFDRLIVCANYSEENLLKKLIIQFKYKFSEDLSVVLSSILKTQFVKFARSFARLCNAVIVPVPIHEKRLKFRGFDHIFILAKYFFDSLKSDGELSGFLGNLEFSSPLRRVFYTKPQAKLNREMRLKNLHGSININLRQAGEIDGRDILLVDDVATTCSTLNECSRALKAAGAKEIIGFVLAKSR